jgi:hypothetical protein
VERDGLCDVLLRGYEDIGIVESIDDRIRIVSRFGEGLAGSATPELARLDFFEIDQLVDAAAKVRNQREIPMVRGEMLGDPLLIQEIIDGAIAGVDACGAWCRIQRDEAVAPIAIAFEAERIETAAERAALMHAAANSLKCDTAAISLETEYRTTPDGESRDCFAGGDFCGAGDAQYIVGREADDLVMAASAASVAGVGKLALEIHREEWQSSCT